jgi:hypothetical protein
LYAWTLSMEHGLALAAPLTYSVESQACLASISLFSDRSFSPRYSS